jgi:hypothetical protein
MGEKGRCVVLGYEGVRPEDFILRAALVNVYVLLGLQSVVLVGKQASRRRR